MNTKTEIVAMVEKTMEKAWKKWPSLKNTSLNNIPHIQFTIKGCVAGKAWYGKNWLDFNVELADANIDRFENTVIHECSHLINKILNPYAKQGHGPEFKQVCHILGGTGTTYHTYDVSTVKQTRKPVKKYEYACQCKTHQVGGKIHNKCLGGAKYSCRRCKTKIAFTGRLV